MIYSGYIEDLVQLVKTEFIPWMMLIWLTPAAQTYQKTRLVKPNSKSVSPFALLQFCYRERVRKRERENWVWKGLAWRATQNAEHQKVNSERAQNRGLFYSVFVKFRQELVFFHQVTSKVLSWYPFSCIFVAQIRLYLSAGSCCENPAVCTSQNNLRGDL